MPLRGKKPEDRKQRLKLLLSGPAGVGKTTAAIQMPKPYIIDTEQGSMHYGNVIDKAGGVVAELSDVDEVIGEVRALMTEKHEYLTLVIDPITTLYSNEMDRAEANNRSGNSFQMFATVNRKFKRLCNLLSAVDMNVIVTAHEKKEYEVVKQANGKSSPEEVGKTFDGYKKLDYVFDLWLQLEKDRRSKDRHAVVSKTRLSEFPDGDRLPWTYEELRKRYGAERLEKGVKTLDLATPEQIREFKFCMDEIGEDAAKRLGIHKALSTVEDVSDLTADRISKGIALMKEHLNQQQTAAA